jgi:hypothetical protein
MDCLCVLCWLEWFRHWMWQGVLALNVTIPGLGKRFMLTKTLEWNLHWCILDAMLDDNFCIREDFKHDAPRLQRRFRHAARAFSFASLMSLAGMTAPYPTVLAFKILGKDTKDLMAKSKVWRMGGQC